MKKPEEKVTKTEALYRHAKEVISGGVQLFSKRPERFAPDVWPAYHSRAVGCEVWDLDGRRYCDMSIHGIAACLLGYRDEDVTRAVIECVERGSMSTLNPPEEVALADCLCEIHPWAKEVRFARTGGETAAVAVRIARATTDKSKVAVCGYHGWHDWYLAANLGETDALRGHLLPGLSPIGVPRELRGTALPFEFNSAAAFEAILADHGDALAAVVMEPCRHHDPEPGFLETIRDQTRKRGIILIFDEISIGWRLCCGGSHLRLGVNPDIAIFAKTLGNGHPIGAAVGTAEAMSGAHDSFISSAYWTECVGPAAALATLAKMKRIDVPAHAARIGAGVLEHWRKAGEKHGLPVAFDGGYPSMAHVGFDHEKSDVIRTLYTQEMLPRGFLAGFQFYPSLAHTDQVVSDYGDAIDEVFGLIARALSAGDIDKRLKGPVAHANFRRLN